MPDNVLDMILEAQEEGRIESTRGSDFNSKFDPDTPDRGEKPNVGLAELLAGMAAGTAITGYRFGDKFNKMTEAENAQAWLDAVNNDRIRQGLPEVEMTPAQSVRAWQQAWDTDVEWQAADLAERKAAGEWTSGLEEVVVEP